MKYQYLRFAINGTAILKLYNHSQTELSYYEKEITYVQFNNQYVMITSGNVKKYEQVYYES